MFADPPYADSVALWQELAPRIRAWLRPDGVLVWETGHPGLLPAAEGLELLEARRYGAAVFHLVRPA